MNEFKKPFESVIYPGAGHAFMRLGEDKAGEIANQTARDAAWLRMKEILQKL
jgi:carboxymethylenebutenolidase